MTTPDPGERGADDDDGQDPADGDEKFRTGPGENSFTFVGEVDQAPSNR